jgi:hypothetical protein
MNLQLQPRSLHLLRRFKAAVSPAAYYATRSTSTAICSYLTTAYVCTVSCCNRLSHPQKQSHTPSESPQSDTKSINPANQSGSLQAAVSAAPRIRRPIDNLPATGAADTALRLAGMTGSLPGRPLMGNNLSRSRKYIVEADFVEDVQWTRLIREHR